MIVAALRRATLTGQAQPVLCGSSFKYVGVQRLLDAVAAYLPSPLDRPPVVGHHPKKGTEIDPQARAPTSRSAAWSSRSPTTPTATCRSSAIYSGTLKAGSRVYNPGKDKKENCSRLYHIRADDREKVERGRRRRHRRRRRPEGLGHRRHALRRRAPDPAGADRVPRDGHQHVDRAGQLGRQGEARRHPGRPGPRGPDLHLQGQRGDRPDADLGHGRAAPGDPQEPDDPRLQAQGPRRPAAGQLPRDDQEGRQAGRRGPASARPAARASTPRSRSTSSPRPSPRGRRCSRSSTSSRGA